MRKIHLATGVAMAAVFSVSASAYALGQTDAAPQRPNLRIPLATNKVSVESLGAVRPDTEVALSANRPNLYLSLRANKPTVDTLSANKVSVESLRGIQPNIQQ